jgi:hypothetical protein
VFALWIASRIGPFGIIFMEEGATRTSIPSNRSPSSLPLMDNQPTTAFTHLLRGATLKRSRYSRREFRYAQKSEKRNSVCINLQLSIEKHACQIMYMVYIFNIHLPAVYRKTSVSVSIGRSATFGLSRAGRDFFLLGLSGTS